MALPSAPRDLAVDGTDINTAKLTWTVPASDGGDTITNYRIERNLNGAGFSFLTNTGNTNTFFTDTPITPVRSNVVYRVFAINIAGTGPASNIASTTLATSEAQTIQELLFNNWSLTGELAKETTGDMTEPVHFFERGQVPGNKFPKAITVQKINALGNENIVEHPKFFEQSDTFEITCFLQIIDSADDQFAVWIDLVQQMTSEVSRILKTQFSPSSSTGDFFRTNTGWTKDDTFLPDDPELTRTLRFTLTRILSNDTEVFLGYPDGLTASGVLVFDTSASQGDSKPASDYSFEQVTRIDLDEGFTQIPILTKDKTKGVGVPQYVRGVFSGTFSAIMFGKKSDIIGSTTEKIQNIYKPQTTTPIVNQNAQVVLLQSNINTETSPVTLTVTSTMIVDRITKISEDEQLLTYRVHGVLTKPSEYAI